MSHTDYQQYMNDPKRFGHVSMLDQFNGVPIAARDRKYRVEADEDGKKAKKAWTDSQGKVHDLRVRWGDDGEEYYVLLTTE